MEEAGVGGEVGGGGGAEGAEAVEEAEHEEDEGLVGGGEAEGGAVGRGKDFEGGLLEGAAEVEGLLGLERAEGLGELALKGAVPAAAEGEDAGEDGLRSEGRPELAGGDYGDRGAAEAADGSGLAAGVADEAVVEHLLDLEDGVDALGGDVEAGGEGEQEGRVEAVVDGDVDLAAAAAVGVHDEGGGGAVTLGEVLIEEIEPVLLGGGAAGGGMLEELAGGEAGQHLGLDVAKDGVQVNATTVFGTGHRAPTG